MNCEKSLLIATGNVGKKREFESLLGEFCAPCEQIYDLKSWPGNLAEVVEDAPTFEGNAIKKALQNARVSGCCTLADDSGLEVDALQGRPGVYSARFAGPGATDTQNNELLIDQLTDVAMEDRSARYVAVVCLALVDTPLGRKWLAQRNLSFDTISEGLPEQEGVFGRVEKCAIIWFRATVEGMIVDVPRGSEGFGYDPHFLVPQWQKTMSEVSLEQKNSISHRARAVAKLTRFFNYSS